MALVHRNRSETAFESLCSALTMMRKSQTLDEPFKQAFNQLYHVSILNSGPDHDYPKTVDGLQGNPLRMLFATVQKEQLYADFIDGLTKALEHEPLRPQALEVLRVLIGSRPLSSGLLPGMPGFEKAQQEAKDSYFLYVMLKDALRNRPALFAWIQILPLAMEYNFSGSIRHFMAMKEISELPGSNPLKSALQRVSDSFGPSQKSKFTQGIEALSCIVSPRRQIAWPAISSMYTIEAEAFLFGLFTETNVKLREAAKRVVVTCAQISGVAQNPTALRALPALEAQQVMEYCNSGVMQLGRPQPVNPELLVNTNFLNVTVNIIEVLDKTVKPGIRLLNDFHKKQSKEDLHETLRTLLKLMPNEPHSATQNFINAAYRLHAILQNPDQRRHLRQLMKNAMRLDNDHKLTLERARLFLDCLAVAGGHTMHTALLPEQDDLDHWRILRTEDFAFVQLVVESAFIQIGQIPQLLSHMQEALPELDFTGLKFDFSEIARDWKHNMSWNSVFKELIHRSGQHSKQNTQPFSEKARIWRETKERLDQLDSYILGWTRLIQKQPGWGGDYLIEFNGFSAFQTLVRLMQQLSEASWSLAEIQLKRVRNRNEALRKRETAKRSKEIRHTAEQERLRRAALEAMERRQKQEEQDRLREALELKKKEEQKVRRLKAQTTDRSESTSKKVASTRAPLKVKRTSSASKVQTPKATPTETVETAGNDRIREAQIAATVLQEEQRHTESSDRSLEKLFDDLRQVDPLKWASGQTAPIEEAPTTYVQLESAVDEIDEELREQIPEAPKRAEEDYAAYLDLLFATFKAKAKFHSANERRLLNDAQHHFAVGIGVVGMGHANDSQIWSRAGNGAIQFNPARIAALDTSNYLLCMATEAFYEAQHWRNNCVAVLHEMRAIRGMSSHDLHPVPEPQQHLLVREAIDPQKVISDAPLEPVRQTSHFYRVFQWEKAAAEQLKAAQSSASYVDSSLKNSPIFTTRFVQMQVLLWRSSMSISAYSSITLFSYFDPFNASPELSDDN